jgi:hypothetical protein
VASQSIGLTRLRMLVGVAAVMTAVRALALLGARDPASERAEDVARRLGHGRQAALARASVARDSSQAGGHP